MKSVLNAKKVSVLLILVSIDFIYSGCAGCRVRGGGSDKVGGSSKEKRQQEERDELNKGSIRKEPIVNPIKNEKAREIVNSGDGRGRENITNIRGEMTSKSVGKSSLINSFGVSKINKEQENTTNFIGNEISFVNNIKYNNNGGDNNKDIGNEISLVNNNDDIRQVNENIVGMSGNISKTKIIPKGINSVSDISNVNRKSLDDVITDNAEYLSNFNVNEFRAKTDVPRKTTGNNEITDFTEHKERNPNETPASTREKIWSFVSKGLDAFNEGISDYPFPM